MPRPRTQRTPPPAASGPGAADEEPFSNAPPPPILEEPVLHSRRSRDPAQEQILRSLPNSLPRDMKLAALGWRGGCFCCPANISFAQCISGLWQAARRPAESADALVHWGLNAAKFLFEAGPKGSYGRNLLLRAGFASLVPQLLLFSDEVPQSIALTPQVFFVQIFATGGRQLPLSTTPQLVVLGLLALTALSPATLRATLSDGGSELLPALVHVLGTTRDDRVRSLTFQTLTEWINIFEGDPLEEDDEEGEGEEGEGGGQEEGGGGRGKAAAASASASAALDDDQDALINALFDAGLAPAVVHVLESSSNAAALRDACAFLLALLAGGVGGGVAAGKKAASAGVHGSPTQHGLVRVAGMTAMELPPGAALQGRARCRARNELLRAGLVPALLSGLSRRPSQLRYWVAINMGVSGARHLEMQWLMLVIARMSVLPPQPQPPPQPPPPLPRGTATAEAAHAAAAAATSSVGSATDAGKGTQPASGGKQQQPQPQSQRGRGRGADPVVTAEEAERLRLAAAEQLLRSPLFSPWLEAAKGQQVAAATVGAASGAEAGAAEVWAEAATSAEGAAAAAATAAAGAAAPEVSSAGAMAPAAAGALEGTEGAAGAAESGGDSLPAVEATVEAAVEAASLPLSPGARAVELLSRAIAGSTLRSCVLPDATPLEALPPRERNATPDFRTLQRDRIRRAADEARAAQALASANAAVDVLSRAVASM